MENDRQQATSNSFGFINQRGVFEKRDLKEYLIQLGVYSETAVTREMSEDLKAYYSRLKQIVNKL